MEDVPWVAIPFKANKTNSALGDGISAKVPCTGYPTPGIVAASGKVIEEDAFGKVFEDSLAEWLRQAEM